MEALLLGSFPCAPHEDTETRVVEKSGLGMLSARFDPVDARPPKRLMPRLAMDVMTSKVNVKRFNRFQFLNTAFMLLSSRDASLHSVLASSKYTLHRAAP
jgi:hypothetical protein